MQRTLLLIHLLFIGGWGWSQSSDSTILTLDQFLDQVQRYHPDARRADLAVQAADAGVLAARAAFDPKVSANVDRKSFDGSTYYSYGRTEVKAPTIFGVEAKAGFEATEGIFLNPEATVPAAGQAVLGLKLPLLRGLLIDQPRFQLRQAQQEQFIQQAEAEAIKNDLLFDATKVYFEWAYAYNALQITQQALVASQENLDAVTASFETGDIPAIDTLEALLEVQSRQVDRDQALLDLENVNALFRTFMWNANGRLAQGNWIPGPINQDYPIAAILALANQRISSHPQMRSLRSKLEQLAVEERWKREQFKPQLDFEYNLLGTGFNLLREEDPLTTSNLLLDNYKLGVNFSIPLLMRKARSGVQLTQIKIADTDWKLRQKEQDLLAKFNIYRQRFDRLNQQLQTFETAVAGYRTLLEAEREIFRIGESSVFLLNSRIQKMLEAELKLLKLQAELRKAEMGVRWSTASF